MPSTAPFSDGPRSTPRWSGSPATFFCQTRIKFILLAESEKPMSSPGYDHLGLLQDSREEVDDLLVACERYAEKDDRVKIKRYKDLKYPGVTVHAFYVKYLLPIFFDVQSMERSSADT